MSKVCYIIGGFISGVLWMSIFYIAVAINRGFPSIITLLHALLFIPVLLFPFFIYKQHQKYAWKFKRSAITYLFSLTVGYVAKFFYIASFSPYANYSGFVGLGYAALLIVCSSYSFLFLILYNAIIFNFFKKKLRKSID